MSKNEAYRRFNAGRPALSASQRTVSIIGCVLPSQREWVLAFGSGNMSLGIRKAIAVAMQVSASTAEGAQADVAAATVAEAMRVAGRDRLQRNMAHIDEHMSDSDVNADHDPAPLPGEAEQNPFD